MAARKLVAKPAANKCSGEIPDGSAPFRRGWSVISTRKRPSELSAAPSRPPRAVTCASYRGAIGQRPAGKHARSEEHTSELQSLMRISYAVFCLKKKKNKRTL